MKNFGVFLFLLCGLLFASPVPAWAIITNLNSTQTIAYLDQLAATFTFRSMEPPSSFGKFGVSLGYITSLTSARNLLETGPIQNTISGATISNYLPADNFCLVLQLPFGFALEGAYFNFSGVRLSGGSVKWSTDHPGKSQSGSGKGKLFKFAAKVIYSTSALQSVDSESSPGEDLILDYSGVTYGAHLSAGVRAGQNNLKAEPYLGAGVVLQRGTLAGTGNYSLFDSGFTPDNTYTGTGTSYLAFAVERFGDSTHLRSAIREI